MTQHDYNIANAAGASVRTDLNNVLSAIASLNSGASAPGTTFAYMLWADTTTGLLKIRNSANTNWVTIGTLATTGLALLPLTGGSLTGALELDAFEDVASSGTTDIGAATSNNVRITGSVTITGLGTATAGVWRMIRFAASLTFTHNAVSLILPGAANITTAANDCALAVSLGSGSWIVLFYQKASGASVVPTSATPTLISSTTHSLTNANNGGLFVFSGSCSLLISRPASLTNGWTTRIVNMAPSSLTPITITASFFVGSGTQMKVLAQPGMNVVDITLINSLYFTTKRKFVSDVASVMVGSRLTFAHGLGGRPLPSQVGVMLRCVSAELGYEVGDEVRAQETAFATTGTLGWGCMIETDDTNVYLDVGANGLYVNREDNMGGVAITNNSWRLYVHATYAG